MEKPGFRVALDLRSDYAFDVTFGEPELGTLSMDEPPPLGAGDGPNAARVLAAAVGHCLSASLLFCLRKAHVEVDEMRTTVEGDLVRNERGRLRIGALRVKLDPALAEEIGRGGRCFDIFEDYCIVTESVRQGIDVSVEVAGRNTAPPAPTSPASDTPADA